MIPAWAPIKYDFDQFKIKEELLQNHILEKSIIATTSFNEDQNSIWDPAGNIFSEEIFKKQKLIHHYVDDKDSALRTLVRGSYNTFQMLNLTYQPELADSQQESWQGSLKNNDRMPLWIKYQRPWSWRPDLNIPYTKQIIEKLPMDFFLTVRCIVQSPPSIGVVHKDAGTKMNTAFFENGFGSVTLNICAGGTNLWFLSSRDGKKYQIEESNHKCWHFDDSNLHCTSESTGLRIQLRVFGKLNKPYLEFLDLTKAIY